MTMSDRQKEIIIIPAKEGDALQGGTHRQLRVASYSRVSTNFEEQLTSFHGQKAYYTDLIMKNPRWTLAGTYADEGISGASAEKRPDFQRMFRHCKKGKIDLIITKSISRFARNTLDSVGYVRKLKAMGIGVIFEKENINTLEENSEVIFTILSSLAQEELNSLSQNVRKGHDMKKQRGEVSFQYSRLYGYQKGADNNPEIIPDQGEVVRRIYRLYLMGESHKKIADKLNEEQVPTCTKDGLWRSGSVSYILQNEVYCGDVLLGKTFVEDPVSKKVSKNHGQRPQVYIKNNHEGIISREVFEQAREERARRSSKQKVDQTCTTELSKYSSAYALTDILVCGECGTSYRRTTWRRRNGEKQVVWRCVSRLNYGREYCKHSVTVDEESLHQTIVTAIQATTGEKNNLIPLLNTHLEQALWQTVGGTVDIGALETQMAKLQEATMSLVMESVAQNTMAENEGRLQEMNSQLATLHTQVEQYKAQQRTSTTISQKLHSFTEFLEVDTSAITTYDDTLVRQLIHTIQVHPDSLLVHFKSGTQWSQPLQAKIKPLY